jgi:hypothetical protein
MRILRDPKRIFHAGEKPQSGAHIFKGMTSAVEAGIFYQPVLVG